MSKANLFNTLKGAFELRDKAVTGTYTVKVGSTSNMLIVDRVISITPAAAFTLTLPNGLYEGQRVLITYVSGTTHTVTVSITLGTNLSLTTAGDFASLEWVNSTVGWQVLGSQET